MSETCDHCLRMSRGCGTLAASMVMYCTQRHSYDDPYNPDIGTKRERNHYGLYW